MAGLFKAAFGNAATTRSFRGKLGFTIENCVAPECPNFSGSLECDVGQGRLWCVPIGPRL